MIQRSDHPPAIFQQFMFMQRSSDSLPIISMQSSTLNSACHCHTPIARRPVPRIHSPGSSNPNPNTNSNSHPPLRYSNSVPQKSNMEQSAATDRVLEPESDTTPIHPHQNPEATKIQRNSLYLTFNAPQVDEYVCSPFFIPQNLNFCVFASLLHTIFRHSPHQPSNPSPPLTLSFTLTIIHSTAVSFLPIHLTSPYPIPVSQAPFFTHPTHHPHQRLSHQLGFSSKGL
jgi:hypothetical protein